MNQTKTVRFVTLATLVLIAFLILTRTTFLTIEPGHAGVKFKRFGGGLQKEKIYEQYVAAFKKGVYDYIKEDYDPVAQKKMLRKYFSGGIIPTPMNSNLGDVITDVITDKQIESSPVLLAQVSSGLTMSSPAAVMTT